MIYYLCFFLFSGFSFAPINTNDVIRSLVCVLRFRYVGIDCIVYY